MIGNASLLSLLTISDAAASVQQEYIFFGYFKQLNEIAPQLLHWYSGKGSDGKANWLWQERAKQWLVVGEDSLVWQIWDELNEIILQ